ncbi:flagellar hook-associated protein 3 [Caldithrix abyssi DSM 13497]|uniref:Flagellar hook-associated protein 3 n=1 Tax=Caldithrix abyssi DSM 13497 TaxID=880073 RepID=H1XQ27_CALAY|nr:flagellar hook-associated protein 3 [Caldithrix abyssi]APF18253.1 flagellin N-terminal helical region [Caldithrix abyssi DSM 13497]EHO42278.1 flagellar hook-associated protein 3 [Caldithrix abyssi DSM 13497]
MRITQSMFVRNTMQRLFKSRETLMNTQDRLATQKKIKLPSDNPVGYSRAQRMREAYRQNEVFLKNIEESEGWLDHTSSLLEQIYQNVVDARIEATKGTDAVATPELMDSLAKQLRGMMDELVATLNTTYLGKNVFGGTITKETTPFEKNDLDVTYQGNDQHIRRRMSRQIVMDINVTGSEIMQTSVFDALKETIVALENHDVDALKGALENLKSSEKNILNVSAVYGSKINNLLLIKERMISTNENFQKFISQEEDAVLEEEMIKLKSEEIAYQAALQSTSQIMGLSLLKYL